MKKVELQPAGSGDHVIGMIAIIVLLFGLIWLLVVRDGRKVSPYEPLQGREASP